MKKVTSGGKPVQKPTGSKHPRDDDTSSSSSSSDDEDDIKMTVVERPGNKPVATSKAVAVSSLVQSTSRSQPKLRIPLDDGDDDDDSESSRDVAQIKVNSKFASDYQKRKEREDALRSTTVFGDEDEDDESSDDEVAEELTDDIDHKINETIQLIRSKDPRIYQPQFRPFGEATEADDDQEDASNTKKGRKAGVKTYKDMVRERALAGKLGEDDDDQEDQKGPAVKSYSEEQEEAKKAFKRALASNHDPDENDDDLELKAKTKATPLPPVPPKLRVKPQDAEEEFLWKYINDRTWLKDAVGDGCAGSSHKQDEIALEEDEEELDKMEEFEQRFNFRFEEPGAAEIVSHARQVDGSLRRKDESARARQRLAKLDRKELERQEKLAELRRLKEARKKMIEEQLSKCFAQAGRGARIPFKPEDLDKDFDPDEWDRKMAEAFNDDYYAEEDEELKVASGEEEDGSEGKGEDADGEEKGDLDADLNDEEEDARAEAIRKIAHDKAETEFEDEDFVGEGKFRYRQVAPNDFGLTDEEILLADNNELNGFVSLKRMAPYAEKEWFASSKHRSRFRRALKKRLEGAPRASTETHHKKKARVDEKPAASAATKAKGELVGQMSSARLKSYGR